MKKPEKIMVFAGIAIVCLVLLFAFFILNESGSGGSSSDDSRFPFFIIYSSWPAIFVAIFVPIMAQKRQEAKKKEEERRNQLKE